MSIVKKETFVNNSLLLIENPLLLSNLREDVKKWIEMTPPPRYANYTCDQLYEEIFGPIDHHDTLRYDLQYKHVQYMFEKIQKQADAWRAAYHEFLHKIMDKTCEFI